MRLFLIFITIMTCSAAHAQPSSSHQKHYYSIDDIQNSAHIANPKFELMARNAMRYQSAQFDFNSFRRYYAQTRQYDPIGERTIERLLELAYSVQNTENEATRTAYLDEYKLLFLNHMAHLGVVMHVISLARDDARFGDFKFLLWLKNNLIKNVMVSGDGYTLQGAYDVITLTEETVLFNYLGLKQTKTISNKEHGRTYYNMHDAVDMKTGQEWTIFVNTTYPMKFLEARAQMEEGFSVDLRKR